MISRLNLLKSLLLIITLCASVPAASAQEKADGSQPSRGQRLIKTRGIDSELNGATLDDLFEEAIGLKATVVIISRLGKGEFGVKLHERRLHNVIERFTYSDSRFSKKHIVAAIGERTSSKGRIEFFINGMLRFISEIDRKKDIRVDCCEMFPQYYPWYRGNRRLIF
jgi:hypothetical protein